MSEYDNDCYKNASFTDRCDSCKKEYDLKDMLFMAKLGKIICNNCMKKINPAWDYLPDVTPIGDDKK